MTDFLVAATNEIHSIQSARGQQPLTPEDLVKIYRIACNTLKRLEEDSEFRDSLVRLKLLTSEQQLEARNILREPGRFAQFVDAEQNLMLAAGLNIVTWGGLNQTLHEVRKDAAAATIPTPEQVCDHVRDFRKYACKVSGELDQASTHQSRVARTRRAATAIGQGVAAVAVAKVNLSLLAISLGWAAPLSAASVTLGYEAAKTFYKKLF
jgi:hypothetical protein